MPTAVKIALIGAGSGQFAGGIVRDLCVARDLDGSHVALMDVDTHRLEMTHRLGRRIVEELHTKMTFSTTTDRREALQGADFVINTAQVGGHDGVEGIRALADQHGYYRGAYLHGFQQMHFFLQVARDMERICPNAWLIQSANPVFEGCTLMHRETSLKILGLCHGHYGYHDIAIKLGLDPKQVTAVMPGFNHWIWLADFRYQGRDAYPLIDKWIETKSEKFWATERHWLDNQMSPAAIHQYRLYGLMPIGDTPRLGGWWYHTDLATKKRWYNHQGGFDSEIGWAEYLRLIDDEVRKVEKAATDTSHPATDTFKPEQSGEQIVPIIDSLVNDKERTFQVNIPNRGQVIAGFPEDLVVECQGVASGAGIRGVVAPRFSDRLMVGAMIPRWHQAELMVSALRNRDRNLLLLYLLHDHRTRSLEQAEKMLKAWFAHPGGRAMAEYFGGMME